jgi:hypothetical protein
VSLNHNSLLYEGISPHSVGSQYFGWQYTINKENQLTKEPVSVPVLLKVMYHIHVCDTLFHILCIFIYVYNNHDQSAIIDEVPPAIHRT